MITSETPYKEAEIIRITWPGLYMRPKMQYNRPTPQEIHGKKHRLD